MTSQLMLPGYCQIPLYESVSGVESNFRPETTVWRICDYAVVDSDNCRWLNCYRWLRRWNPSTQSYYAYRWEKLPNGKWVQVQMASEVLGLSRGTRRGGVQADHIKQDQTLKNTRDNLRRVSPAQNNANQRKRKNSRSRFKGIAPHRLGFLARIKYNGQCVCFPTVRTDAEAALMYNYAAYFFWGDFAHYNDVPESEWPSEERRCQLWDLVVSKLTGLGLLVAA